MNEQHRELIKKFQPQFIQAIVENQCLEWLINQLLSLDHGGDNGLIMQDLLWLEGGSYTNEAEKVRVLFKILSTRGRNGIDRFFKAIIDTKQATLISILTSQLPPNQQIENESSSYFSDHSSAQVGSNIGIRSFDRNSGILVGHMQGGTQHNYSAQGSIYFGDISEQRFAFNSHNHDGRMVSGSVQGGTVVQGDYHYHLYQASQAPSASSFVPYQLGTEDWQQTLVTAQQSLKEMYCQRFKETNPFSLPFTFHIENMWVSVALTEDAYQSQATEDHAELLRKALANQKMLIIEGDPATGKTSLMRRLAYEWAKGKDELSCYDLVLYAEFRKVHEKTFESIADLVLYYLKTLLKRHSYEKLEKLMNDERFCEERRILLLLDGYDESSTEKQCSELKTYLVETVVGRALLFNVIITTRKGYLSHLHGWRGRFVFAEVLGFTTKQQKEKYILNHFLSAEIDNKHNIVAVHSLLDNNENLNKLAETPLFLTFICLLHERIKDGTLLELYCNIIWWLIDRHQQDFPDRDIPRSLGFQNGSSDKFETIQDHYLHFPQLLCLGKMALHNLEENEFKPSDCAQFNLQPIIEQIGLLRKEKKHDNSFKLVTSFFFPHRTIQEFLAAFYCFCSNDDTSEWLLPDSELDTSDIGMDEFERFLFRIALSDDMPLEAEKFEYYFDRITYINLDMTFDAFDTAGGFNDELLNRFLSQCRNVKNILLTELNREKHGKNSLNDTSMHNESAITPNMSNPVLSISELFNLHSMKFFGCAFSANSQLSFTYCSLSYLIFEFCSIESSTIVGFETLTAIDTVELCSCSIDMATWQSITDQISNSDVRCFKLTFEEDFNKEFLIHLQQCNNVEQIEIIIQDYKIRQNDLLSFSNLTRLHSLTFGGNLSSERCTFSANSQLSFTNCPFLTNLKFKRCVIESSTNLGLATLPAIDTMQFDQCSIDLATWQSITDQISNSNVKCLQLTLGKDRYGKGEDFNKEFLIHLQQCSNVDKMDITISGYTIRQNDLLSFSNLTRLHSLTFASQCKFSANSQLSFRNCLSLTYLKFRECEIKSSTIVNITTLPASDTMQFDQCSIDLATWQSITDQISNSNVKCLQLSADFFVKEIYPKFLHHLQKCGRIQQIHVSDVYDSNPNHVLKRDEESVTANLALTAQRLPALTTITISDANGRRLDERKRLSERNRERIEKAGQQRNPHFSIKYVEYSDLV